MASPPLSIVIPVGPHESDQRWLIEAVDSVRDQMEPDDEILLIDDMADILNASSFRGAAVPLEDSGGLGLIDCGPLEGCTIWWAPWHLGVAHAFNFGVALAEHEHVVMLGADDRLLPGCLDQCRRKAEIVSTSYRWLGVEYSDDRPDQFLPCNAAMVTKALWRITGGFPIESSTGAPDAALISILMKHGLPYEPVNRTNPLYWYRVHPDTDTAKRGPWQGVILSTRDRVTADWKTPEWGRYS